MDYGKDSDDFVSKASLCFANSSECPNFLSQCFKKEDSNCPGEVWSSRYDNASAAWVVYCAILMFFMKAGFLYLEQAFCDSKDQQLRAVLAKYIDIFAGTFGFWLFGYAISGNTDAAILGEEQDYIFWFFRFTFASNTATILGGALVGQKKDEDVQMRTMAIFVYSFAMTAFIHPFLARLFWSTSLFVNWSPFFHCNGTFTATRDHEFTFLDAQRNDLIFIDFAGSGLVHLCGGVGGFILIIFHKGERVLSKKFRSGIRYRNFIGWCDRRYKFIDFESATKRIEDLEERLKAVEDKKQLPSYVTERMKDLEERLKAVEDKKQLPSYEYPEDEEKLTNIEKLEILEKRMKAVTKEGNGSSSDVSYLKRIDLLEASLEKIEMTMNLQKEDEEKLANIEKLEILEKRMKAVTNKEGNGSSSDVSHLKRMDLLEASLEKIEMTMNLQDGISKSLDCFEKKLKKLAEEEPWKSYNLSPPTPSSPDLKERIQNLSDRLESVEKILQIMKNSAELPTLRAQVDNLDTRLETIEEKLTGGGSCLKKWLKSMYQWGESKTANDSALAILILWTTWFAFNAGSIESISGKAIHAAVGRIALVMCVACASAGTVQIIVCAAVQNYLCQNKVNNNEIANVILGALVAVTGCCPFIDHRYAIIIGVFTVVFYHLGCFIEYILGLYDGGRVFPVHAMCGLWGVLCVGIFSRGCLIQEVYDSLCFCVFTELPQSIHQPGFLLGYQIGFGLVIIGWSALCCAVIFGAMWCLPINIVLTCLPKIFCFKKRGIEYTGNMLFTHLDEIPKPAEFQRKYETPPLSRINCWKPGNTPSPRDKRVAINNSSSNSADIV